LGSDETRLGRNQEGHRVGDIFRKTNGEHVKLNGVCLHHDGGAVGAAVPERVWERRFEILREMRCNAIRTSHNPPAPEFLDLCDRMGFLVMTEAFDEWKAGKGQVRGNGYSRVYDEWHERDVTDLVRRDRNHPSVVLWSCGNEIGDQLSEHGVEILRELLAIFHREDPTRPVTAGCDQIAAEPKAAPVEFLNLLDVVGYNYADRWRERREMYYSLDKAAHPNWRMIGTESTGMGGQRGDYRGIVPASPGQAAVLAAPSAVVPTVGGGRGFGRGGVRGLDTEQLWKFVRTHDYVAGDFMWTGIDYLGEAGGASRGASSGSSIVVASPRTATTSIRANGARSRCCICSRTGTGRGTRVCLCHLRATPIAIASSCFSMADR
jgi:beta-galactosidase